MKAIISRLDLIALVGKIQTVVSPKASIPILANILVEAKNDELILSATDLVVSVRTYCTAKIIEEGSITLPARRFFQLVRELTAPEVELHCASPEIASLNAGASHFKLHGMHKSEFPAFPDLSNGVSFSIPTATLKEMLSRTAFAAAREDSRQVLNGILLQSTHKQAVFTATDGKRLAKIQAEVDLPGEHAGSYILPLKAVEEIIKMLEGKEKEVQATLMPDKFAIEVGSTLLITKLFAGQYPDVSRVIPEKKQTPIALHREELISLLRQVSLFTSEEASSVKFSLMPGVLHLSAMSGNIGEGNVSMPVNYGGPKLEIAFNPQYFLDILRHSKDETVNFDVTDSYNPGLVTDSSSAQFVLMPMRLE